MLAFLLATSLWMPLSDWPAEATKLVERHGPPQRYTHHTLVWDRGDRVIEALRNNHGQFMVVQTLRVKVPESSLQSVLDAGRNIVYDGKAGELRVWGDSEEETSRLLEEARSRLR